MKRASDRQRAKARRTHQLGESDASYEARVKAQLEAETGLTVEISRTAHKQPDYIVRGYTPRGLALQEPLIQVVKPNLLAAASAFDYAAEKLRGAGVKT